MFRAGDAQGKSRKDERTQAGVLITGTFILRKGNEMYSFGVRFSKENYIKVNIDFSSRENDVTLITEVEGTPLTVTGAIIWDESYSEGEFS